MPSNIGKHLKERRGFTLIELMMVVAVIIILAAVLIPRIGAARKEVKVTAVLQNANMVRGILETLIDKSNYQSSDNGAKLLGERLEAKLDALDGDNSDDETDATNPYNQSDKLVTGTTDNGWEDWSGTSNNAVVAIDWNTTTRGGAPNWADARWSDPDLAGCVMVAIYRTSGDQTWADVVPYDSGGTPMEEAKQTVKP